MIDLKEIMRQLTANARAMHAMLQSISNEQAQWKPNPETWSMKEVMEHVYNEERLDFRQHLKEMLSDPPQPWRFFPEEYVGVEDCRQALEGFLAERETSLAWLKALETPAWDITTRVTFEPSGDVMDISTGDVLVAWVAHDFLHIRQMNELLFAWNEKQAAPYSVRYAGGW
jgi:hypothetical protein